MQYASKKVMEKIFLNTPFVNNHISKLKVHVLVSEKYVTSHQNNQLIRTFHYCCL